MRAAFCFGALAFLAGSAAAQPNEHDTFRARAALALAGASGQAATPPAPDAPTPVAKKCKCEDCACKLCDCKEGECYTCLRCAAKAAAGKKPLALWVGGVTCQDHADVRAELPNYVHVHLATFNGSSARRLLIETSPKSGDYWKLIESGITVDGVRATQGVPQSRLPEPPPQVWYTVPQARFGTVPCST